MRHEQITDKGSYDKVDIAAMWPASAQIAPLPVADIDAPQRPEIFRSMASTPDVPAAVGGMIALCYGAMILAFVLATAGSAESIFMITISALFVVTFFTVPRLMLRQEPRSGARPSLDRFLSEGIDTLTGHNSGRAALIQMLIVPVFLTLGILALGIATAIIM